MNNYEIVLLDEELIPDPDADLELSGADVEPVADEDVRGCRLLVVQRSAEPVEIDGKSGGAIQLFCTFQPGPQTRFTSASLLLKLISPNGIHIHSIAPRTVQEGQPIQFTINQKGHLGLKYSPIEANAETSRGTQFSVYHCSVQGSGEGTSIARWIFAENPQRRDGIGREQALAVVVPITGTVKGTLQIYSQIKRPGLQGAKDKVRDLVLQSPNREYAFSITIPPSIPPEWSVFLRS